MLRLHTFEQRGYSFVVRVIQRNGDTVASSLSDEIGRRQRCRHCAGSHGRQSCSRAVRTCEGGAWSPRHPGKQRRKAGRRSYARRFKESCTYPKHLRSAEKRRYSELSTAIPQQKLLPLHEFLKDN